MTEIQQIGIVLVVVVAAVIAAGVIDAVVTRAGRRIAWLARLSRRTRSPFRFFLASVAALSAMHGFAPPAGWHAAIHIALLLVIGSSAWLLTSLLFVVEDTALPRLRTDIVDNRHARAIRTQLMVLRRVTAVVVTVIALGAALMTFREARLVGTSLLASAGVVAAIAAFATNALLGNVVAGLQIAFSGALRLDDVVVVEQEWGRVEEITLTYVVVHIWDDRRLILPASYFTTQVFENWTHTESELLGEILFDVDWAIDINGFRERLGQLTRESPLWDGRVCVAQMVDAVGGHVSVRALVSAVDAPTLWDLRCHVREGLVGWIRDAGTPPRTRAEIHSESSEIKVSHRVTTRPSDADDRVFSGARGESFAGPAKDA